MLVLELGHRERIDCLMFAPDGASLVASSGSWLRRWRELANGARATGLAPGWAPFARFTPDGKYLFAAGVELHRIDVRTNIASVVSLAGQSYPRFDLSPDGQFLLVPRTVFGVPYSTRFVCRRTDDLTATGVVWEREHAGEHVDRPHYLPDGDRFVCVRGGWVPERRRAEFHLVTFDAATGDELGQSDALLPWTLGPIVSPDGRWFAGTSANRIDAVPLVPGLAPVRVKSDARKHFTGLAFHPNGRFLAATSNDKTVKLYDTATWELARTFTWHIGRMRCIAFSPDGTLAAAGSDTGQVVVWDVDG